MSIKWNFTDDSHISISLESRANVPRMFWYIYHYTNNHFRATKCENKAYTHQTDCTQQYAKILGFYHIKPALKNQAHPKLGWRRQSFAKVGSWGKKLPISPS